MNYVQRIIELFTTRDVSQSGKEAFYRWLADEEHSEEKKRALREFWSNTQSKTSSVTRQSLRSVKEKLGMPINKTKQILRIWQTAAAVLLVATLSSLYLFLSADNRAASNLVEQYVPVAEMGYVTLPDGSEVQLNSKSVLLYPKSFGKNSRSVYLTGEANFKVKRNEKKPFIVKSSDFQVTVLGTEFDILAYPEDSIISATVLSGSVKVEYNNLQSEMLLSPNQQLAYNKVTRQQTLETPDMQDITAWQRGELVFKGTSLNQIITVLERKYPYKFTYSLVDMKDDKFTFRFKENATLPEVMDIIVRVVGDLRYKIEENNCVMY